MIRIITAAAAALALVAGVTTPAYAARYHPAAGAVHRARPTPNVAGSGVAPSGALTADQLTILACTELPDAPSTPLLNPPDCTPATVSAARARILAYTASLPLVQMMCVDGMLLGHTAAYQGGFCTGVVKRSSIDAEIYAAVGVDDRVFLADV